MVYFCFEKGDFLLNFENREEREENCSAFEKGGQ